MKTVQSSMFKVQSWPFKVVLLLAIFNSPLSIVNSVMAQSENAAFYIYQKGGRVNGFFYDEVEKITYSYYDTRGIEYDEYMSQEVVTADSTYRFLLSDIDSIGFVQPEVKMGPRVRYSYGGEYHPDDIYYKDHLAMWDVDVDNNILTFCPDCDTPRDKYPQIGDVFIINNYQSITWGMKVDRVEEREDGIFAYCSPITEFSDIYQQLITVEQYGYDDSGNMIKRRVAGRPELNIGQFPKKAKSKFEGDVFNFSLNGHFPLYNGDDLTVSIDPSLKGKVHVRVDYNIPLIGSKYIGITTRLDLSVQTGFTVDGKIGEAKKGGFGTYTTIPLPATTPIMVLDLGPDGFIRGQADVKFMATSPESKGSIWCKLEIKDWWPSIDFGTGNPEEKPAEPKTEAEPNSYQMELSGWLQAGCNFPMKFASLPIMKKIFNATIGGEWFIGPKLSGSIAFDFTTPVWNDDAMYNQMKNTKISMSLLDADYEISADVESVFSSRKKWTLADGSISLFSPFELSIVPEFGDCVEYDEEREMTYNGELQKVPCKVFAFEPKGYVFKPIKVGVICIELDENDKEVTWTQIGERQQPYFQSELSGEHTKDTWPELVRSFYKGVPGYSWRGGKYRLRPYVELFHKRYVASPSYDYEEKPYLKASSDTLYIEYNGEAKTPVTLEGICDEIFGYDDHLPGTSDKFPDWIKITNGGDGKFEISPDAKKFKELYGYNHTPGDTLITRTSYEGTGNRNGNDLTSAGLVLAMVILPNKSVNPVETIIETGYIPSVNTESFTYIYPKGFPVLKSDFKRNENNDGWHCTITSDEDRNFKMEYDIVGEAYLNSPSSGAIREYSRKFYVQNGTLTWNWREIRSKDEIDHTLDCSLSYTFASEGHEFYLDCMKTGSLKPYLGVKKVKFTVSEDGGPAHSAESNTGPSLTICFPEYNE